MKTIPLRIICTWKEVQFLEILNGNRPQILGSLEITLQWDRLYLKELIRIGMLKEEKVGREKIFLHQAFLKLLQESEP